MRLRHHPSLVNGRRLNGIVTVALSDVEVTLSVPLIIMRGFQPSKIQMSGSSDSFCLVPLAASFFSLSSSPSYLWSCLRESEVSQVKSVYFNHPSHGNSANY